MLRCGVPISIAFACDIDMSIDYVMCRFQLNFECMRFNFVCNFRALCLKSDGFYNDLSQRFIASGSRSLFRFAIFVLACCVCGTFWRICACELIAFGSCLLFHCLLVSYCLCSM